MMMDLHQLWATSCIEVEIELAERGLMLCTAEMSPLHYLPHLNTNVFQLPIDCLLNCIGFLILTIALDGPF